VLACAVGVLAGGIELPPLAVAMALADRLPFVEVASGLTPTQDSVLMELRLPRVVLAALVGGALAIAGAAYQGVFRNPLADPYLLGAAAGAGLGATLVIVYVDVIEVAGIGIVPLAAFAGALVGVGLAYALGVTAGRAGTATLVLAGVAVTSFLTAVQTFVQQREVQELRRVYSWILGQLGTSSWHELALLVPYVALSSAVLLLCGRLLDVLSVGDDEAAALGVRAVRVRLVVVVAASLATAAAVAVSGLIGFVGIVVPHIVRRLTAGSYRVVLPLSLLGGGAFLVLADVVARTFVAPAELPIGVVTAFVGAPFFVAVLRLSRRGAV
ncbi:MAG TPA: iron ABC transporter permease, partial [Cryptosporangiaceae bacterium]|nr:iron ABC transporter permease [Cryptosporangiaceae bacterium]